MKKLFLAVFVLVALSVNAQQVYTSSGHAGFHKKAKKKGFDPAKLILGGGINGFYGSGYANFGIAPIVGYKITEDFSAGVGLGYQFYKAPYAQDQITGNLLYEYDNIVYPSVWARYMVFRNIFAVASFEYDFIGQRIPLDQYGNTNQTRYNITVQCMPVGIGIKQPMGGRVSGIMEVMLDVLNQPSSPYYNQPIFRIGFCAGI